MADDDAAGADYEEENEYVDDDIGAEVEISTEQQAFNKLYASHPECVLDYVEETVNKIPLKVNPPRRFTALELANNVIKAIAGERATEGLKNFDEAHKSYPYITRYEYTRVIGFRANQLSQGAKPFINVPEHVSDVREIARMELAQKRLPFIIKRPLPDGTYEYWRLQDLLQI